MYALLSCSSSEHTNMFRRCSTSHNVVYTICTRPVRQRDMYHIRTYICMYAAYFDKFWDCSNDPHLNTFLCKSHIALAV